MMVEMMTRAELIAEVEQLRRRVADLEAVEPQPRQARPQLPQSEAWFAKVFHNSPMGISISRLDDGRFVQANDAFLAFIGYCRDEVINRTALELQLWPDPHQREQMATQLRADQIIANMEASFRRKGGELRNGLLSLVLLNLDDEAYILAITTDITDRNRSLRAMQAGEIRYRGLFEDAAISLWEIDLSRVRTYLNQLRADGVNDLEAYFRDEPDAVISCLYLIRVLEVNRATLALFKAESKEVFIDSFNIIFKNVPPQELARHFVALAQGETTSQAEDSPQTLTGEYLTTVSRWSIAPGHEQNWSRVLVSMVDITERKRIEEALQESEQRYKRLLRSVTDYIYTVTVQDGYPVTTTHGPGCFAVTGYTSADYEADPYLWYQMIDEADRQAVTDQMSRLLMGETVPPLEHKIFHKNGDMRWVRNTPVPRHDEKGHLVAIDGLITDITARKLAEDALRESEERLRTVADFTYDWEEWVGLDGTYLYVSPSCYRITGYRADEFIQDVDLLRTIIHPDDQEKFDSHVTEELHSDQAWTMEYRIIARSGEQRWIEHVCQPVYGNDGSRLGRRASNRDISVRKRAEETLQRYAQELQEINDELKTFAYIVSHDLRVPLINIKGFSEELRFALSEIEGIWQECAIALDEEKQQMLETIFAEDVPEALGFIGSSVNKMDAQINAILKLSRLGRRQLSPEPIEMTGLVESSLKMLAHQIEQEQITVSVGRLPPIVADRTAMEQVISNMLTNAVKYMVPGRPGRIEIRAERDPVETTFHIGDNGRGIAKEDFSKVFAIFRRAGAQDVPGEGMGLAYVQTLIRRHRGQIWFESELGQGTTFSFTIPNMPGDEDD